jgi:hypothetical protein
MPKFNQHVVRRALSLVLPGMGPEHEAGEALFAELPDKRGTRNRQGLYVRRGRFFHGNILKKYTVSAILPKR